MMARSTPAGSGSVRTLPPNPSRPSSPRSSLWSLRPWRRLSTTGGRRAARRGRKRRRTNRARLSEAVAMSAFAPPAPEQLIAAARALWGQETSRNRSELRFGKHGSKSLDLEKLCYFDHEAGEGGGYVSLFQRAGMELPDGKECDQDREFAAIYPYRDETGTLLF